MKKPSDKKLLNKMFEKNDNYDDLLEMTVTGNKVQTWLFRILFFGFLAALVLILF